MINAMESRYDKAKEFLGSHPEYVNIASSLALGFLPAILYGKEPYKLGLAIAFHAGASVVTHYLKEHDYINPLAQELIDYATSVPIFLTSFHSYNDFIKESKPLSTYTLISTAYEYGADKVAEAFSFGTASLANMVAASEIGKAVLRAADDEEAESYQAGSAFSGVYLGLKYFPAMLIKCSLFPEVPEGASRIGYSHHYFGAGAVQGVILQSTDQLFDPFNFEIHKFAKDTITSALDSGVNAFLYKVPGNAAANTAKMISLKQEYPVMHYYPISAIIEDSNLLMKKWHGIPEMSEAILVGVEHILSASNNATMIDEF